jgi:hypothetical protein
VQKGRTGTTINDLNTAGSGATPLTPADTRRGEHHLQPSQGRDVIPEIRQLARTPQLVTSSGRLNLHLRIGAHHLAHCGHGGGTDVDNLTLLCPLTHR